MLVKTEAIIFSALKYGEADLIVKAFTKSSGLKSYLLRNILKSKKGKLRVAMFQPLTHLEIEANHKDKGTLESLREAKVISHYRTLHTSVVKSAIVFFMADMLRSSVKEEEENQPLFEFISAAALWLDHQEQVANFHALFILRLTRYLGFFPEMPESNTSYFNLMEGSFVTEQVNVYCLAGENIDFLKSFLGTNFDKVQEIKMTPNQRSKFLTMLLQYYELHLHGFKKPRSLAVLNSIFN